MWDWEVDKKRHGPKRKTYIVGFGYVVVILLIVNLIFYYYYYSSSPPLPTFSTPCSATDTHAVQQQHGLHGAAHSVQPCREQDLPQVNIHDSMNRVSAPLPFLHSSSFNLYDFIDGNELTDTASQHIPSSVDPTLSPQSLYSSEMLCHFSSATVSSYIWGIWPGSVFRYLHDEQTDSPVLDANFLDEPWTRTTAAVFMFHNFTHYIGSQSYRHYFTDVVPTMQSTQSRDAALALWNKQTACACTGIQDGCYKSALDFYQVHQRLSVGESPASTQLPSADPCIVTDTAKYFTVHSKEQKLGIVIDDAIEPLFRYSHQVHAMNLAQLCTDLHLVTSFPACAPPHIANDAHAHEKMNLPNAAELNSLPSLGAREATLHYDTSNVRVVSYHHALIDTGSCESSSSGLIATTHATFYQQVSYDSADCRLISIKRNPSVHLKVLGEVVNGLGFNARLMQTFTLQIVSAMENSNRLALRSVCSFIRFLFVFGVAASCSTCCCCCSFHCTNIGSIQ